MADGARPITRVYPNRPQWQVPARSHWLVTLSKKQPTLTAAGIVGGSLCAAAWLFGHGRCAEGRARSANREWQARTKAMKVGKAPIYWETKAKPAAGDDY